MLEPGDDLVPKRCAVNLDSVESVAVAALTQRLGPRGADTIPSLRAAPTAPTR